MRHLFVALVSAAVLATPLAAAAQDQGGGLSPSQLQAAGWTCFNVPTLGVHCSPPGKEFPPSGPSSQLLYFHDTTDTNSTDAQFTGTESLLSADVYNGQPCPTEGNALYTFLGALGLNYYACHRH